MPAIRVMLRGLTSDRRLKKYNLAAETAFCRTVALTFLISSSKIVFSTYTAVFALYN